MREVVMVGAGLHRYGVFPEKTYVDMGVEAIQGALTDAGCAWTDIDAVYCGTVRLGMSAGHHICLKMGTTGLAIPTLKTPRPAAPQRFVRPTSLWPRSSTKWC